MTEAVSKLSRRTLFAGVGTAGAVAAVVGALPQVRQALPDIVAKPKPERGGGYSESEHVKRYYKTAQV
jgi:hypothetical protein